MCIYIYIYICRTLRWPMGVGGIGPRARGAMGSHVPLDHYICLIIETQSCL